MPKGLPQPVRDNLEKCSAAAIAAVEAYNRPGPRFRTAQYLVLIVMAWTAVFHAVFYRRGRRPWYRKKDTTAGKGVRYQKIDGEPKHWDLNECLKQFYGDQNPPERKNLEFLLGLRNKIEHRHLPVFDASIYGECQAALLNLEELLVREFGARCALAENLAVSLQFSQTVPPEKAKALKTASSGWRSVRDYVERFRSGLPVEVLSSMKYSFSVFLVPKVANRLSAADASVQFVKVDEASPEELKRLEQLNVLIRDKHIPIANLDLFNASEVVRQVGARIPFRFNLSTHMSAWRHFKVRPAGGAQNPERTVAQYCVHDKVHKDWLYTTAWIEKLVRELATPATFQAVTGRTPQPK